MKGALLTVGDEFLGEPSGLLGLGFGGGNTLVAHQLRDQGT